MTMWAEDTFLHRESIFESRRDAGPDVPKLWAGKAFYVVENDSSWTCVIDVPEDSLEDVRPLVHFAFSFFLMTNRVDRGKPAI